jgi:Holliday junction resolvasome RuvABC endonuclease subunit
MKKGAAVIALDISSRSTGVAIFNSTDGSPSFEIELIVISDKLTMGARLQTFEKELKRVLKANTPVSIIIEEVYRGPNIKTFKTLSYFHGMALKVIWDVMKYAPDYISVSECRSNLSKRFGVKPGLKTKEDVINACNELFKIYTGLFYE